MPSDDRLVQTDRQATLYYRISEDTVAMGGLLSVFESVTSSKVSLGLAFLRIALGVVLCSFYAIQ